MAIGMEFGFFRSKRASFRGPGYMAGEAPESGEPDALDGRFKILNVPSRGRVVVMERSTLTVVDATLSKSDGTWRIDGLSTTLAYTVIGFDDRGLQNAAIQDWIVAASPGP